MEASFHCFAWVTLQVKCQVNLVEKHIQRCYHMRNWLFCCGMHYISINLFDKLQKHVPAYWFQANNNHTEHSQTKQFTEETVRVNTVPWRRLTELWRCVPEISAFFISHIVNWLLRVIHTSITFNIWCHYRSITNHKTQPFTDVKNNKWYTFIALL